MRKIYFIFVLGLLIVSCKNDAKSNETKTGEEKSGYTESVTVGNKFETFTGMFLYLESDNAAVLQSAGSNMYGVVVDDQMFALNDQCKPYKKESHSMIPVVIRGVRKPNPTEDAWEEVIEIKEIVSVQKPREGEDGTIIIKNNQ